MGRRIAVGLVAMACMSAACIAAEPRTLLAAAASLRAVMPKLLAAYSEDTTLTPRVTFGSSGNLFRQISQGAPFEIFLSADSTYVQQLTAQEHTLGSSEVYAHGRLALMVLKDSPHAANISVNNFLEAVNTQQIRRIAIPHPRHAPYGRAAREFLEKHGVWNALERHLVVGENAAQATQFGLTGAVDAAIVPFVFAFTSEVTAKAVLVPLGQDSHRPLVQRMVMLANASPSAHAFYAFMQSEKARVILDQFGLHRPE